MAIENKNNPESIVNTPGFNPPRNWKNWTSVRTWSGSSGPIFPVKHWDLPKDATCKIDLKTLIKSLPSATPLLAHFKMRYSLFFCPYRLYVPNLNNDNVNELSDIEQIAFPTFSGIPVDEIPESSVFSVPTTIRPGSVLHYLGLTPRYRFRGYGGNFGFANSDTGDVLIEGVSYKLQANGSLYLPYVYLDSWDYSFFANNQNKVVWGQKDSEEMIEQTNYMFADNAIPYLAYIDCFTHYFANPNEDYIPYRVYSYGVGASAGKTLIDTQYIPLAGLQAIVPYVSRRGSAIVPIKHLNSQNDDSCSIVGVNLSPQSDPSVPTTLDWQTFGLEFDRGMTTVRLFDKSEAVLDREGMIDRDLLSNVFGTSYAHQGMFMANYLPDYFTTWVDPDDYQLVNSLNLPNMNIQQIRLAERKWVDYARQLAKHSKRYSDWLEQKYGGPRLKMDTKPIFVGSDTLSIYFEDVTSTAETDPGTYSGSLGAQTSKVDFVQPDGMSKPISFTTQEPGLLICLAQIVPEVSYGQGTNRFFKKKRMSDLYSPLYDAVGFQSIYASEVDTSTANPIETIGDVPGWYEYMSDVNTHTGLFSLPEFKSWVLERDFYKPGDGAGSVPNLSTYIDPSMYDANFVNIGQYEDNFMIQTLFDFKVKLPMSNQIINTRW